MSGVMGWRQWPLVVLALMLGGIVAEAKTPGKTYCFLGVCHRVKSLAETRALVGRSETLHASHYNDAKLDRFNPSNVTSSGAYFFASKPDNAASPIYPDGTVLLVWNPTTRKAAVVRVNNAGPYYKNRKLDLSRAAAMKLGFGNAGVARVVVKVLKAPTVAEARYRRGRTYPPVAGYIGSFGSLQLAAARIGAGGGGGAVEDGRIQVADGAKPMPSIGAPRRKPMLLAALVRAEKRAAKSQAEGRPLRGGVGAFDPIGGFPGVPARGGDRVLAGPMVLSSLTGTNGSVRLPQSMGVTNKRDVAHKRVAQVAIGRPRIEPLAVFGRNAGGSAKAITAPGVSTQAGGGVKSVDAGMSTGVVRSPEASQ